MDGPAARVAELMKQAHALDGGSLPPDGADMVDSNWRPAPGKHRRAGITKNKGRGTSKARRKIARESRRRNRGK